MKISGQCLVEHIRLHNQQETLGWWRLTGYFSRENLWAGNNRICRFSHLRAENGSLRFRFGYHTLDVMTIRYSNQLPRMKDCIVFLGDTLFFWPYMPIPDIWRSLSLLEIAKLPHLNVFTTCTNLCEFQVGYKSRFKPWKRDGHDILIWKRQSAIVHLEKIVALSKSSLNI